MICVDRKQFIDCIKGNLLTRNSDAVITELGDAATHAVEAAEKGEIVYLTINNFIVSKIVNQVEISIK